MKTQNIPITQAAITRLETFPNPCRRIIILAERANCKMRLATLHAEIRAEVDALIAAKKAKFVFHDKFATT